MSGDTYPRIALRIRVRGRLRCLVWDEHVLRPGSRRCLFCRRVP